ncbi:hypothetical protein N8I77_005728 [Diaporthe amygdali]|uniref:Cytochrome P450 n=1 Tax=Phomopsis amygdali TaxID=1214568 RepID=A0AAD9SHQ9_PHOAM|nr:hypothetical protein N8I77_005728 [Diaporthe amygdali]
MSLSTFIGAVVALVAGCYLLEGFIFSRRDAQEPLYIRPRIPLIGHLLDFMKKGPLYFDDVEAKYPHLAIFSLPIFSFKFYVVTDRQVFAAVQRNAKTVSFAPFSKRVSKVLSDVSDITVRAVDTLAADEETRNFARQVHHIEATTLSNGNSLDRLNLVTSQEKLRLVDDLVLESSKDPVQIELYEWIQHLVTISASTGFYGPKNPYKDPQHEKDFWTFNSQIPSMTSGLAWLFAPKAHKARNNNSVRYEDYARAGGFETASDFIKERSRALIDNGSPVEEAARMNTGLDVALISNYAGIAFWTVYHVLSHPGLITAVRDEVEKAVVRAENEEDFTLDVSVLRTSCPLLVSTMQETQRLKTTHSNIREVISDTKITAGGKDVLLKKGNYVQLHGSPVLHSQELWGDDADEFDPYRFIRMKKDSPPGVVPPNQLPTMSFPVWGVAPHVCPARFYASTGVMVLVALVVLRLDISPAGTRRGDARDAAWQELEGVFNFSAVSRPQGPVHVSVRPRKSGMGKWGVVVGKPNTRLQFSVA